MHISYTACCLLEGWLAAVGSHHDALESYQTAVSLAPARLIHRVELGRTLDRLGRKEQARQELEVGWLHISLLLLLYAAAVTCSCTSSCRSKLFVMSILPELSCPFCQSSVACCVDCGLAKHMLPPISNMLLITAAFIFCICTPVCELRSYSTHVRKWCCSQAVGGVELTCCVSMHSTHVWFPISNACIASDVSCACDYY